MNTRHAEQNDNNNVLDALARVEPGYVEITRPDGAVDYLFVHDFEIGPNFVVSVGFANERPDAEGNRGKQVFLHKRMQIRHLGMAAEYLEDPFVHQVIATFDGKYPVEAGLIPLLRTVELVRSGRALLADAPALLATLLQ